MTNSKHTGNRDKFDEAVRWALDKPELEDLMQNTYTTHNTLDDAQRFASSDEFAATIEIFSDLGHPPEENPRVLDVGCGNGIASYALTQRGYEVVAVDSSSSNVCGTGAAEQLTRTEEVDFDIHTGDIRAIEFDTEFDIIYARQFFHHMTDLDIVVDNFLNNLNPGGILCALRDHVIWNEEQREQFLENHPLHHITQSEGAYYLEEYREAFSQDGLQLAVELHPYESPINTHPKDLSDVRDSIAQKIPLLPRSFLNVGVIDELLRKGAAYYSRRSDQIYSFFSVYEGK